MYAYYLDAYNCDWGYPCQFNASSTIGNCKYMSGVHIIIGNYGKLMVDNLNTAWIDSFPRPLHEGHGKASFYIDLLLSFFIYV
ncbi:MAG TPA: DUF1326 domain-containing protein [Nitrososphaeraceae archaeon]|nr:DUF1326 domain-containing protein [Nitrososphaeraceae archaeon]